jgi:hypothetical protein
VSEVVLGTLALIDRIRARVVEQTFLYACSAAEPMPVEDVRITTIAPEQIDDIGSVGPYERTDVRARLVRGDTCYGAWHRGELAHFSWVQTRGVHQIAPAGITVGVEPGAFWIYNCRTHAAHRGAGLYTRVIAQIAHDAFAAGGGMKMGWIYTTASNVASQRGIVKAGFVQCDTFRALHIGRRYRALRGRETALT